MLSTSGGRCHKNDTGDGSSSKWSDLAVYFHGTQESGKNALFGSATPSAVPPSERDTRTCRNDFFNSLVAWLSGLFAKVMTLPE